MFYRIKQAETEADFKHYYHLRWQLLRAPWSQPEGSEIDDIETSCFHVMATDENNKTIGVARLQFNANNEAQLRYMAVSPSHEKQGIGRALIQAIEQHAHESSHNIIMLHARENAVGFYKKSGYQLIKKVIYCLMKYNIFTCQKSFKKVSSIPINKSGRK